jgi:hypothetical protein
MAAARMANLKNGSNQFQKLGVPVDTPTRQEAPVSRARAAQLFAVGQASVGRARRVLREAFQKTVDAIDRREFDLIFFRRRGDGHRPMTATRAICKGCEQTRRDRIKKANPLRRHASIALNE